MEVERYYTIPMFAKLVGFSEAYIRAACNRAKGFHPLPCLRAGDKRPVIRIRLSDWERWAEEEKAR